jgi:hypothetical protein
MSYQVDKANGSDQDDSTEPHSVIDTSRTFASDFVYKLQRLWKYRHYRKTRWFYDVKAIQQWMKDVDSGDGKQNGARLYYAINKLPDKLPHECHVIFNGENPCVKVWVALFSMDAPELIGAFYDAGIRDNNFTTSLEAKLDELRYELRDYISRGNEEERDDKINNIIRIFKSERWSADPVYFTYRMNEILQGNPILPFVEMIPVNRKGGQATVYKVTIPECFVCEDIQGRLSVNPDVVTTHEDAGKVCALTTYISEGLI